MTDASTQRPFRVSILGPIGSGKTLLIAALSQRLWPRYNLAVATVDGPGNQFWPLSQQMADGQMLTKDAAYLLHQEILPRERVTSVERLAAICDLFLDIPALELLLVEQGGNDLATAFDPTLIDFTIYVLDVTYGCTLIQQGGTGIVHADLLVLNKIDQAQQLGVTGTELAATARLQRGDQPFALTNLRDGTGLDELVPLLEQAVRASGEAREARQARATFVEEQWFWRYKLSRGAHTHFQMGKQQKASSSSPMSSAPMRYCESGQVAWDEMWTNFCDLAALGGPPHRGTLLEPVSPAEIQADPTGYERVVAEIERGLRLVTDLAVLRSTTPGWVGMVCESEAMAIWLQQAILAENVSVRREGCVLYLPAGPTFQLKAEIKNVITAVAKTHHYWQEHLLLQMQA